MMTSASSLAYVPASSLSCSTVKTARSTFSRRQPYRIIGPTCCSPAAPSCERVSVGGHEFRWRQRDQRRTVFDADAVVCCARLRAVRRSVYFGIGRPPHRCRRRSASVRRLRRDRRLQMTGRDTRPRLRWRSGSGSRSPRCRAGPRTSAIADSDSDRHDNRPSRRRGQPGATLCIRPLAIPAHRHAHDRRQSDRLVPVRPRTLGPPLSASRSCRSTSSRSPTVVSSPPLPWTFSNGISVENEPRPFVIRDRATFHDARVIVAPRRAASCRAARRYAVRVKSANDVPLTRATRIAARLYPLLLYDHRVPGSKFSTRWWLDMSSTCACVWIRVVRGHPAIAATLPQSRSPRGVIEHLPDYEAMSRPKSSTAVLSRRAARGSCRGRRG